MKAHKGWHQMMTTGKALANQSSTVIKQSQQVDSSTGRQKNR